jgi:hypothetical protein
MERRKYSLHQILYERTPLALAISLSVFIPTLFFAPISISRLLFDVVIGLFFSLISIEELTDGTKLSWLYIPIIVGGDFLSKIMFYGDSYVIWWVLFIRFLAILVIIDSVLIIVLRARIEEFCQRKLSEQNNGEI